MTQRDALLADVETRPVIPDDGMSKSRLQKVIATMRRFATVSELLRVAGAAIMVGAMSVFLMQGWLEGNDVQRYFKLLAQTLLLTAGGFSLSFMLREHKGARLFFGLSLVSVVANFTILGALIYSVVQFDGLLGHYPDYASWIANDPVKVFATSMGAAVVLVPVTILAFAVLARRSARWLSGLFLASGALLLLPVRASLASSILAIAAICVSLYLVRTLGRNDETLTTFEGRFARLSLFLAPIIMLVRSSYFYTLDSLTMAMLGVTLYLLLRHVVVHKETGPKLRGALDIASWPVVVLTATALTDGLSRGFPASLTLPIFALACAPMIADLVLRSAGTFRSRCVGVLGALLMCTAVGLNELFYRGLLPAAADIVVAMCIVLFGYWVRQRWVAYIGVFTVACLCLQNLGAFFRWFNFNNWVLLSLLGAGSIVLASLLDRYGAELKLKLDNLRQRHLVRST